MSIAQEMRLQTVERELAGLREVVTKLIAALEAQKDKRDTLTLKKAPKNG